MEEYDEGTICTVSGWGTTTEGGSLARVLQKVDVPVVSDEHCRDSYGQSDITDSMICAGNLEMKYFPSTNQTNKLLSKIRSKFQDQGFKINFQVSTRAARTPARETLAVHSC